MKNNEVTTENRLGTVASPGAWPSWIDACRQYILLVPTFHLSILTAIFPGEPGLASFIEAKDNGSGGDNWCNKSCKATVKSTTPTNQHPASYRQDALPVAQPTVSKYWRKIPTCHLRSLIRDGGNHLQWCAVVALTPGSRLVVLESGLGLECGFSPFLLDLDLHRKDLDLRLMDLDSDLGRFVTKSTFNFRWAHLQCFV